MIQFVDLRTLSLGQRAAPERYDVAFVGETMDDRGILCREIAAQSAPRTVRVSYQPSVPALSLDGEVLRPSDMEGIRRIAKAQSVLLDATSLDFVEMLLLCRAILKVPGARVGFVYAEPQRYVPVQGQPGDPQEFAFSDRYQGNFAVPGFAHELRDDAKGYLVVGAGYESDRLQRMLDDDDGAFIHHTTLIFGVPPYQTSWELHAFLPHLKLLDSKKLNVTFAAANNPRATMLQLKQVSEIVINHSDAQLLVAPLGSKPSSIGMALFSCLRDNVRLKYDFPVRIAGRTQGVGSVYRYLVANRS